MVSSIICCEIAMSSPTLGKYAIKVESEQIPQFIQSLLKMEIELVFLNVAIPFFQVLEFLNKSKESAKATEYTIDSWWELANQGKLKDIQAEDILLR